MPRPTVRVSETPPAADLNYTYDAGDQRVLKTAYDAAGEASHTVYLFDSLELRRATSDVQAIFRADMKVGLVNDGPVTLWLDSRS